MQECPISVYKIDIGIFVVQIYMVFYNGVDELWLWRRTNGMNNELINLILLITIIGEFLIPWILKHYYKA